MADCDVMIPEQAPSPLAMTGPAGDSLGRPSPPQSATSSKSKQSKHISMSARTSTIGSRPSTALADLEQSASPVNDYLRPIINAANRRWKLEQEGRMMNEIIRIKNEKKEAKKAMKEKAQQAARKIPIELLGRDWLVMKRSTIETRAYLVEKILPLVVLGVEKLLMEVDARGLTDTDEPNPNFNPVNFLAQYLLRNNPRYSNFTEASPYMRSMRRVTEQLKGEILNWDDSRLARLKADARKKREEYEFEAKRHALERARRLKLLQAQFLEWGVGNIGKVEIALVVTSLRSFSELAERFPAELKARAKIRLPSLHPDQADDLLNIDQFCDLLLDHTDGLGSDIFDQLVEHLTRCAWAYQGAGEAAVRREMLEKLFNEVDRGNVGTLDRHRVLALFEQFYDGQPANVVRTLRNPRRWPVVQLDEEVSSEEEEEDDDVMPVRRKKKSTEKKPEETEGQVEASGEAEKAEDAEAAEQVEQAEDGEKAETTAEGEEQAEQEEEADGEQKEETPTEEAVTEEPKEESQEDVAQETTDVEEAAAQEPAEEIEQLATEEPEAGAVEAEAGAGEEQVAQATEDDAGEAVETKSEGVNEETGEAEETVEPQVTEDGEAAEQAAEGEAEPDTAKAVPTEPAGEEAEEATGEGEQSEEKPVEEATKEEENEDQESSLGHKTSAGVSFAEGTIYRETTQLSMLSRSHSRATAFDEDALNESQFVQTTETFLGELVSPVALQRLIGFIRDGYVETEEERRARMLKIMLEQRKIQRKQMADDLFDKWDNDGSGYLEFTEVDPVVMTYKGGMEEEALKKAKRKVRAAQKHPDGRMTKKEFRFFLTSLADLIPGDDAYEYLVEFLLAAVVRSYQERIRGEARKKWLASIRASAITSAASMEPVFRAVFQALFKDAETHGGGKRISAYISMLEHNDVKPSRGPYLLRYVACTPADAEFMIGQTLFQDMKGISFASVEGGKPIHVPRVLHHGNVHIFNPNHTETRDGAFIVVPLKDRAGRVFGLLGIDTISEAETKDIFITHEIQFFQGVAKAFSVAYHAVDIRHKTMMVAESAVAWLHRRCQNCCEINFYMIEPDTGKKKDVVLRRMMVTDEKGMPKPFPDPPSLRRQDNLFRDYLFKCVDTSDSVAADAYGERHLAFPVRDKDGMAVCVLDIGIGKIRQLSAPENKEMTKMLRLLQTAYMEIVRQSEEESCVEAQDVTVMFDKLMLEDLKENVRRLDAQAYGEIKSYTSPPRVIQLIIRAVLSIFHPEKALDGQLSEWGHCKPLVGVHLGNMIIEYDPTASESVVPPAQILALLDDVPHGEVSKVGSKPAEHLYNWVFVCLSLLEHTRKMKAMRAGDTKSSHGGSPRAPGSPGSPGAPGALGSPKPAQETDLEQVAGELQQQLDKSMETVQAEEKDAAEEAATEEKEEKDESQEETQATEPETQQTES